MPKLNAEDTLKMFKIWLHKELMSEDTEYAFVIDQVGETLHIIQEFGEVPDAGHISYDQIKNNIIKIGAKGKCKSAIGLGKIKMIRNKNEVKTLDNQIKKDFPTKQKITL